MNVVIFSPYATVAPHFETELDIAQQHLDHGDRVEFVSCWGELSNCDFNLDRDPDRCQQCRGRREMGLQLLTNRPQVGFSTTDNKNRPSLAWQSSGTTRGLDRLPVTNASFCDRLPMAGEQSRAWPKLKTEFGSVEELASYRIEQFDIGYAALSSLVSACRDPEPELGQHRELLRQFLESSYQTYRRVVAYLEKNRPDRCYVFNGRFANMRAVFRGAEKVGVPCFLHERGCDGTHYSLRENHLPHDINATDQIIRETWNAGGLPADRQRAGAAWFEGRRAGVEKNWHSFTKGQQPDLLPDRFDCQRKNIVIFNSSDDEFVAIGDCWKNELYPDQIAGVVRLVRDLQVDDRVDVYLRMHPNLQQMQNRRKTAWQAIDLPNLTILPSNAAVDSYALMQAADTVVSFGSTAGIEAVFWQRPSLLLGPCFYQNLVGPYRPKNHQQAIELLRSDLAPQPNLGALMYGFWQQTFGIPHRYFQAEGLFDGKFKGELLYARPPVKTWATRLKNEWNSLARKIASPFAG